MPVSLQGSEDLILNWNSVLIIFIERTCDPCALASQNIRNRRKGPKLVQVKGMWLYFSIFKELDNNTILCHFFTNSNSLILEFEEQDIFQSIKIQYIQAYYFPWQMPHWAAMKSNLFESFHTWVMWRLFASHLLCCFHWRQKAALAYFFSNSKLIKNQWESWWRIKFKSTADNGHGVISQWNPLSICC